MTVLYQMILSIDIGLRNLAMCIMNCTDKTDISTYTIHLWDVFNTLDSDDYHCQSLQKNGKVCNKKCSMKYANDNDIVHCCKSHFPKTILANKNNTFKKKMIDDYLLQDIANIVLTKLQDIYDTNPIFKQLTSIVIELQPKINQKMKFTSHIIYGKLVELMRNTSCTIRFVRASQKLKAYTGPEITCNLKGEYAKRKWLSIQYTKWFLNNKFSKEQRDIWLPILENSSKADDMSDTKLMCINAIHGIAPKQAKSKKGKCIK